MISMHDKELETIRRNRLKELQQQILLQEKQIKAKKDSNTILNKLFKGRASEVFNASASQFPKETAKIRQLLVKLALGGKISEVTGEQLFALLKQVGLPVKLNTSINYYGKGKTKTLSEKLKDSMK